MEHEEDSDLERIEQADDDENDEWNDAPYFSTPRHHKHRNCNSTRLLHSPSQHRRRVLRRHSSGGSDAHAAAR